MTRSVEVSAYRAETVRVRKNPHGRWHQYRATVRACGTYGWGDTPTEARAKLMERLAEDAADGYRRAAEVLERLRR